MTKEQLSDVLCDIGCMKHGHFLLSDGTHSDTYIQKNLIYALPQVTEKSCEALAAAIGRTKLDTIVSPAVTGILLGHGTARVCTENNGYAPGICFSHAVKKGTQDLRLSARSIYHKKVLIVDDTLTCGTSITWIAEAVRTYAGEVIGAAVLFNRSGKTAKDLSIPRLISVFELGDRLWVAGNCPECAKGTPLMDKPGKPATFQTDLVHT